MSKFCNEMDYPTIEDVRDTYPDAADIVEVEGGWQVFATTIDADTWRNAA